MELLKKAKDPAFWRNVKFDKNYAPILAEIKTRYEEEREFPLPPLTKELRDIFVYTGSRTEFEDAYFKRRRFFTCAALLALVYPEEEAYLNETKALIEAVSNEFSWALPAHASGLNAEAQKTFIDLFAAESGLQLTEICYLLGERLDGQTLLLAEREVTQRIVEPFLHNSFWWEKDKSNWAAVCAGNVGACILYLAPERFEEAKPRILNALDSFLSSYPEDGTCLEGFSYWHYGFGEFVWFADLLLQFTDGKTDLLNNEKAERIAGYARRSFLAGDACVSFSDALREEKAELGLAHYLARRFERSAPLPPERLTKIAWGNLGWHKLSRLLMHYDPRLTPKELEKRDYFLDAAGQAVVNRGSYSLAVKAGRNDEPHNHNDVGGFILATERGQIIADVGAGVYTREYFAPETRYSIFCNSSRGHSVPIVDGQFQKVGKEYCGTLTHGNDAVTVEIAGAYGLKSLVRLSRRFEFLNAAVRLTDSLSGEWKSFTERFILLKKPTLSNGAVVAENVKIYYDEKATRPVLSKERHAPHTQSKAEETVYLLDFSLKKGATSIAFLFEIL